MNVVLEVRHWMVMIGAVTVAIIAKVFVPHVIAIYPVTTYAFPIIAVATILDTFGAAAERHRTPLKLLAWVCLLLCHPDGLSAAPRRFQRYASYRPCLGGRGLAISTGDLGKF